MSSPEEIQSHRDILADHAARLSKIEAYLKVIAVEATLLIPLTITILFKLWR